MTMAIFRDEHSESFEVYDRADVGNSASHVNSSSRSGTVPIIEAKLRVPSLSKPIPRRRLTEMLKRNAANSAGTLIVGRSGSGKTYLAAEFVKRVIDVMWYSIDAGDTERKAFQCYFATGILKDRPDHEGRSEHIDHGGSVPELFDEITTVLEVRRQKWPSLIVLDGIHHLFDCDWFADLFDLLISSLPYSSHVIMLSRSKPPTPMWRLRSKQILSFIDEKTLAFTLSEAEEMFVGNGLTSSDAGRAFSETFGRPRDLIRHLETLKSRSKRNWI